MSPAIHGWWCNARTYPTTCRYCGQAVFYFSCDCGCKVFFDYLGDPWPKHLCIQYIEATYGRAMAQRLLEIQDLSPGRLDDVIHIDPAYAQAILSRQAESLSRIPRLVRQDPSEGTRVKDIGYLREIGSPTDFYDVFDLPRSVFSRALLGNRADREYVQITVHTGDLSRADGDSYTGFVESSLLANSRIKRGELVRFSLISWGVPGRDPIWLCNGIEKI